MAAAAVVQRLENERVGQNETSRRSGDRFGVRWQAQRDTALDRAISKAPSSFHSAGGLQIAAVGPLRGLIIKLGL
jgi:hypothetical protein